MEENQFVSQTKLWKWGAVADTFSDIYSPEIQSSNPYSLCLISAGVKY